MQAPDLNNSAITRCICFNKSFLNLKEITINSKIKTFEELQTKTNVGMKCGLCKPYIMHRLKLE